MKPATLIFVLLSFTLAACSSNSHKNPYQPAKGAGYGYKESALSSDRYRVHYKARGNDRAKTMDMALLRAAELTLLEGYDWFVVIHRQQLTERDRNSGDSSFSASRQQEVVRDCGLLGCTTRTRPSSQYDVDVHGAESSGRRELESILEIRMGKGIRPAEGDSYDAYEVSKRLKAAHGA